MHPKSAWRRHWIDEARKRRGSGQGKVISLGEIQRRNPIGRHASDRARDRLRAKSCGVHDNVGSHAHGREAAGLDDEPPLGGAPRENGCLECDHRAMGLGVPTEGEHKGMAVDNASRGRQQRSLGDQRRLEGVRLLAREPDEIGDAIRVGLGS